MLRDEENRYILILVLKDKLKTSKRNTMSSDDGKEVTPVPIPNTEVKLFSAHGSWGLPPARVGRR